MDTIFWLLCILQIFGILLFFIMYSLKLELTCGKKDAYGAKFKEALTFG